MSLQSLIATGTKLWLDSVDPELVIENRKLGATGATSNPIIVADIVKAGAYDEEIRRQIEQGADDVTIAWHLTDLLVRNAQQVFADAWRKTRAVSPGPANGRAGSSRFSRTAAGTATSSPSAA